MKIINKFYSVNNKLDKNIVLISDLHYQDKKDIKILNNLLDNIKKLRPDYICIPGDITHKTFIKDEREFINWFKKLSKISKVIISLGNHEFFIKKYRKIYGLNKELLKKISNIENIHILDNENIIIDNINFIGLTIPMEYYKNTYKNNLFYKCLDNLKINKKYYNILLCHSPINICNKEILKNKNIDLILSGHMHGGIVPKFMRKIFKHNGLISPNKRLFPRNVYGNLKIYNTTMIISSGIKVIPFRKINTFSPEVVKIEI